MTRFEEEIKSILYKTVPSNGVLVDILTGNVFELLNMAQFVNEGQVYSFCEHADIVESAYRIFEENFQDNVVMVQDPALNFREFVSTPVDGILYNVRSAQDAAVFQEIVPELLAALKSDRYMIVFCKPETESSVRESLQKFSDHEYRIHAVTPVNYDARRIYLIQKIFFKL